MSISNLANYRPSGMTSPNLDLVVADDKYNNFGPKVVPRRAAFTQGGRCQTTRYTSSGTSSNSLANGAKNRFELSTNLGRIMDIILKVTLTDTSATPSTPASWAFRAYDSTPAAVDATSGSYKLHVYGYGTTASIAYDAATATIQTALRAIHDELATVVVTGSNFDDSTTAALTITMPNTYPFMVEDIRVTVIETALAAVVKLTEAYTTFAPGTSKLLGQPWGMINEMSTLFGDKTISKCQGADMQAYYTTFTPDDDLKNLGDMIHYDFDKNRTTGFLQAGGHITYYIPLFSFLTQGNFIPAMFPDIRVFIDVLFQKSTGNLLLETWGGTGTFAQVTVGNVDLFVTHFEYEQNLINERRDHVMKNLGSISYRIVDLSNSSLATGGISPTLFLSGKMTNTVDLVSAILAVKKSAITVARDEYMPYSVSAVEINARGSSTIEGHVSFSSDDNRFLVKRSTTGKSSKLLARNFPYYLWTPSLNTQESIETGRCIGYDTLQGDTSIKVKSTAYTGNANLVAYLLTFADVELHFNYNQSSNRYEYKGCSVTGTV